MTRDDWRLSVDLPDGRSFAAGTGPSGCTDPGVRRYVVEQHWPGSGFDELVAGRWLHVERMSKREWWMNIAGVVVNVAVRPDGFGQRVSLDLEDRDRRCTYLLEGEPW